MVKYNNKPLKRKERGFPNIGKMKIMEILQAAELLGQAIKNDPMVDKLKTAKELYNDDTELLAMMDKYNETQQKLKALFNDEEKNSQAIEDEQKNIEELYHKITENENFIRLDGAQNVVNNIVGVINEIISNAILGDEGCTHNCSSCKGCH